MRKSAIIAAARRQRTADGEALAQSEASARDLRDQLRRSTRVVVAKDVLLAGLRAQLAEAHSQAAAPAPYMSTEDKTIDVRLAELTEK